MRGFLFATLYLASPLLARPIDHTAALLEEMRVDIDDLKYALKSTQVELNILDEKMRKQETSNTAVAKQSAHSLESKIAHLEKPQEKAAADLRALNGSLSQALAKIQALEQQAGSQEKRLDDIAKLKETLTTISKAIGPRTSEGSKGATYRVKAGDSLEKIARNHRISVDHLKKLNHLTQDKIIVGQELKIADDLQ